MRSSFELLKTSFSVIKNNFHIYATYSIVMAILSVLPFHKVDFNISDADAIKMFSHPVFLLSIVTATLGSAALGIMLLKSVADNTESTFAKSFEFMKQHYLSFLWVFIIVYVTIIVGFMLLIIPGFIAMLFFAFAPFVLLFEGIKGFDALKQSARYVKTRFGSVLWRLFVLWAISIAFSFAYNLFFLVGFMSGSIGVLVIGGFINALMYCLAAAYMYGMYTDIKSTLASAPVPAVTTDSPVSTGS